MTISFRTPAGHRQLRIKAGEYTLLKTSNGNWRVTRQRNGGSWAVATRRWLVHTLLAAWRNRDNHPGRTNAS